MSLLLLSLLLLLLMLLSLSESDLPLLESPSRRRGGGARGRGQGSRWSPAGFLRLRTGTRATEEWECRLWEDELPALGHKQGKHVHCSQQLARIAGDPTGEGGRRIIW